MTTLFSSAENLVGVAHRLAWLFVFLKVASTVVQIKLFSGDYRRQPQGMLFRAVYLQAKLRRLLLLPPFA